MSPAPGGGWTRLQVWTLPRLLAGADRLPLPLARAVLAASSVAMGLAWRPRWRRLRTWALAQPAGRHRGRRLALAVLVARGQALALANRLVVRGPTALEGRLTVSGAEHLAEAVRRGPCILLIFHLGPGGVPAAARRLGHAVTTVGHGTRFAWPAGRDARPSDITFGAESSAAERADALVAARRQLRRGEVLAISGDGIGEREAFRIPLPGAALVVRAGWLALRQVAGARVLPAFSHDAGGRWAVTIHPALPAPVPDLEADRAACAAALTPLIQDYVARFPVQCGDLALETFGAVPLA